MKTNFFPAILISMCVTFAGGYAHADDAANARTKEMQKQRLKALTTARDYLDRQFKSDDLLDEVNSNGFIKQLLDAHKQVLQARLDLSDTKAERIKAIEDSIKDFESIVAAFAKHFKMQIVDSTVPYHLAQAQLLEMKISLEKAKQ